MPEPIATFNKKTACRVYNQTNEFVYLGGDVNHNAHEEDRFDWICGPHEGHETAEVRDVWKTGEGRGLRGVSPERVGGVFRGRPHSFWYQRRPVEDCNPVQGGTTKYGETRGGTFHDLMSGCKESQGPTAA